MKMVVFWDAAQCGLIDTDHVSEELYSRLLVEPSVHNGASPTSVTTMR
jgi:hypothetical protein